MAKKGNDAKPKIVVEEKKTKEPEALPEVSLNEQAAIENGTKAFNNRYGALRKIHRFLPFLIIIGKGVLDIL